MTNRETTPSSGGRFLGAAGGALLAAAAGWILYSKYGIHHHLPLPDAIPARRDEIISKSAGRISYYSDTSGSGRPLVLVHSINAAASAYEVGPLFAHYRGTRPVYALDLPGYGFSDRGKRIYHPELFENALTDFLAAVVGAQADVIALSLGGEFSARAALSHPELVHSLVMISPTGLNPIKPSRSPIYPDTRGVNNALHAGLSAPLWGRALFDFLVTHTSIEYFLQKSFVGQVPPGLIEYGYLTTHQPDAENAPLYFISGKLFTPSVRTQVYERLRVPTLVIYDRDPYTRFKMLPDLLLKNPNWQAVRLIPSKGLPHFERLADTVDVINGFYKGIKS